MGEPNHLTAWVPPDTLASRLRAVREAMHLTVPEIAELCEVPVPTWRKWEHGASPRGLERHVKRISEKTGVNRSWLMWGAAVSPEYPSTAHALRRALTDRHQIDAEPALAGVR